MDWGPYALSSNNKLKEIPDDISELFMLRELDIWCVPHARLAPSRQTPPLTCLLNVPSSDVFAQRAAHAVTTRSSSSLRASDRHPG